MIPAVAPSDPAASLPPAVAAPPPVAPSPALAEAPLSPAVATAGSAAETPPAAVSAEAVPAAPTPEAPAETKPAAVSLLGDEPKAEEKPAPPETPASLPAFEKFTLPEGVSLEDDGLGKFTSILGEYETSSKADHAAVQALGQKFIDLYVAESQATQERLSTAQREIWQRTNKSWQDSFKADPEIGGNRWQTTLQQCNAALDRYGSEMGQDRLGSLRQALKDTGAGNHPEIIRWINWAARMKTEQSRQVPATVPASPVPTSRIARRYHKSLNGAA